jgi:hypothetical protein
MIVAFAFVFAQTSISNLAIPANVAVGQVADISFDILIQVANPFAAETDRLDASISRGSTALSIPAYYGQAYSRRLDGSREVMNPDGQARWHVRFCPDRAGNWQVKLHFQGQQGPIDFAPLSVNVKPGKPAKFVGLAPEDRRYFQFSDGSPYFPIGANVCWGSSKGTYDYDDWLPKFGANGANYIRIWLDPGWAELGFDKTKNDQPDCGFGRFDLKAADRLDRIFRLAQAQGIYVMLCLDACNELQTAQQNGYWDYTPQNKLNGGPLSNPTDFWTDPTMAVEYQDKMRYLVARYSAEPNLLSWEMWNEVDGVPHYDTKLVAPRF